MSPVYDAVGPGLYVVKTPTLFFKLTCKCGNLLVSDEKFRGLVFSGCWFNLSATQGRGVCFVAVFSIICSVSIF